MPRMGAGGPAFETGGDECAAARNGSDAELRPMQSRPPDLCRAETHGYRAAVRAAMISAYPGHTHRKDLAAQPQECQFAIVVAAPLDLRVARRCLEFRLRRLLHHDQR